MALCYLGFSRCAIRAADTHITDNMCVFDGLALQDETFLEKRKATLAINSSRAAASTDRTVAMSPGDKGKVERSKSNRAATHRQLQLQCVTY